MLLFFLIGFHIKTEKNVTEINMENWNNKTKQVRNKKNKDSKSDLNQP